MHRLRSLEIGETLVKLLRFGLVGGAATLLYGLFAVALQELFAPPVLLGHALAYHLAIPASYLGQRSFTFRYRGSDRRALKRFLVTAAVAFAISTAAVYGVEAWLGWPYLAGTLITMLVVPLVSFATMLLWVFFEPEGASAGH